VPTQGGVKGVFVSSTLRALPNVQHQVSLTEKQKKEARHFKKQNVHPYCVGKIPLNNMPFRYTRNFLLVLSVFL
jgi:hypothetical protein